MDSQLEHHLEIVEHHLEIVEHHLEIVEPVQISVPGLMMYTRHHRNPNYTALLNSK
jgi:hypothetical protein